ncbi:hypothetical protein HHI36_022262 [Cryptolaemus montrouzieri]|uniref:Uncharacterized protein n=1 Tax=Cryptolaemus montrouzieri TaxID=559131 RepID=A0ABD2N029_9CUCU
MTRQDHFESPDTRIKEESCNFLENRRADERSSSQRRERWARKGQHPASTEGQIRGAQNTTPSEEECLFLKERKLRIFCNSCLKHDLTAMDRNTKLTSGNGSLEEKLDEAMLLEIDKLKKENGKLKGKIASVKTSDSLIRQIDDLKKENKKLVAEINSHKEELQL